MKPESTSARRLPGASRVAAVAVATIASLALAACSSSSSSTAAVSSTTTTAAATAGAGDSSTTTAAVATTADSSTSAAPAAAGGTFQVWDPYPQFKEGDDWVKLVQSCGTAAGATIKRTGYDTSDLPNKTLLAAQQGAAPDIVIVDNPVISTLADAGILTTTDDMHLDIAPYSKNILAAGQIDGKTYGVPIGANTLALYYNKAVLKAAGVDPASVKDWASLTDALKKIKAAGYKGITFSAVGTEEGSFQFLPWFWGSGADLTKLDSDQGVSALQLWTDWVKQGLAPQSVISNTQTTAWQDFATKKFGFTENGTWQLNNAKQSGIDWGLIPIPGKTGGVAPAPTGGEFVAVPVQKDTSRYATDEKIVQCLTQGDNALKTDTTLSYISANEQLQAQQATNPDLTGWVKAVQGAKGRTSDNLGTKYPKISEPMWGAIQAGLTGTASAADAMKKAQADAAAATG